MTAPELAIPSPSWINPNGTCSVRCIGGRAAGLVPGPGPGRRRTRVGESLEGHEGPTLEATAVTSEQGAALPRRPLGLHAGGADGREPSPTLCMSSKDAAGAPLRRVASGRSWALEQGPEAAGPPSVNRPSCSTQRDSDRRHELHRRAAWATASDG